ncbi:MAG TPA: putative glycoside hydrolase [Hydrogenispora sp.]|nr:putative glycoside hydrolase [Hydrogenispora sp.]
MWKKTRICVLLFVLFVFSVRIFSSSETKPTGFLLSYEKLFPKQMTSTVLNPPPAIPPRGTPPLEPEPLFPRVTPTPIPEEVRGVYVTGWVAGTPSLFKRLLRFIDATPVNSLVIDIKDDTGKLSYRSAVPMVNTLDAWENKIPDVQKMLKTLQQKKVYPIARLVVFKDPYLAEKRPEFALKQPNGEVWRDYKGMAWVDPHAREVWEYNIQIAKEAVKMGFSEIQFDYVRFASDGDLRSCVYPYADGSSKEDVIRDFLLYAREELEPLGAVVSADVFGLACSAPDDLFIGQKLEKIAEAVPVICPMVYPSHYARGSYGLANPDLQPYATVLRSLQDAGQRLKDYPVKLRPWLQDFSLGNAYGPAEIQAQIQAVYDAGVREWLFWNPSCRYNVDKYVARKNEEPDVANVVPSGEGTIPAVEDGTPSPADQGLDSEAEETTAPPGETHDGSRAEEEESAEMAESVVLPPVVLGLTAEEDEIEEKSETEEPAVCPVEAVMDVQEKNVDCTDPAEGGDLESMDPMEIPCAEEAKDGASEDVNDDSTSGGEMKECIGEFKEE